MPTITGTYKVVDDRDVSLDIIVGDGQKGGSSVSLIKAGSANPSKDIASGANIAKRNLGSGKQLRGAVLVVSTLVQDIRPETDWTSVTVGLSNGEADHSWPAAEKAKPGGTVSYIFVITFG
jgi:hypothetical protein